MSEADRMVADAMASDPTHISYLRDGFKDSFTHLASNANIHSPSERRE